MNLQELQQINQATQNRIAEGTGRARFPVDPYFGVLEVRLFECPPFLMFTANDCPRAANILFDQHFEPMSMAIWCRLARQASSVFDVGAHVGVYALAAASACPNMKIHAFEPNPYAYARLRVNKALNNFSNLVDHRFGLSDRDDVISMSWDKKAGEPISSGASVMQGVQNERETIAADIKSFDSLEVAATVGDRGLFKIDVEGTEYNALRGMQNTLRERRPDIILETFSQESCDLLTPFLLPLGYNVYRVREDTMTIERLMRLKAATWETGNFNLLLSCRSFEDLADVLKPRA